MISRRGLVDFEGNHVRCQDIGIVPHALQPAQKLIWLAVSKATVRCAERASYTLFLLGIGPAAYHQQIIEPFQKEKH